MSFNSSVLELINTVSLPVLVFDQNFTVTLTNRIDSQAFKMGCSSLTGKSIFDVFEDENARRLHDACLKTMELRSFTSQELILPNAAAAAEINAKLVPLFNSDSMSWNLIFWLPVPVAQCPGADGETIPAAEMGKHSVDQIGEQTEARLKASLLKLIEEAAIQIAELKEEALSRLSQEVEPFLEGLKNSPLSRKQRVYVDLLESSIRKFTEPFFRKISSPMHKLSPTEMKIAGFIREGKTNKEMAKVMNLSKSTILTHRHHIRAKLGLKNQKKNLRSYLSSLGYAIDAQISSGKRKA
jgi:DNA-binding CsgD family transcriptional regulator